MTNNYRSKLEKNVGTWMEDLGGEYESFVVDYTLARTYTPDFTFEHEGVQVEIKGWFRPGDRQKYLAINESLIADDWTFVFIFQNPNKPVGKGAKSTMADWADRNGIPWFAADDASGFELWLEEVSSC